MDDSMDMLVDDDGGGGRNDDDDDDESSRSLDATPVHEFPAILPPTTAATTTAAAAAAAAAAATTATAMEEDVPPELPKKESSSRRCVHLNKSLRPHVIFPAYLSYISSIHPSLSSLVGLRKAREHPRREWVYTR